MAVTNLKSNLDNTTVKFRQSSARTQLVILYYLAQKLHRASKVATPSALFSQKVHGVLKQIQQLSCEDRYVVLEEILRGSPTRLTEAYDELDTNMRIAFWYRLANNRKGNLLPSMPYGQNLNLDQEALLSELDSRDSNELVTFLREAVEAETMTA
ncbi:orange carotenoid protein N-terminal domain-containing protein [Oscillatoria sp. CS-180]|uniref:orange carotenoid protein N-terminal domain-containing protein n=1 Tax=Oscillatoria sp. CS-180 TaxID=3021720 RepID=UPI002330CA4D|nr:orange carotenoid protein N-terminal domain-containing protein [Oscillatoria sp. CS-180]MDB9528074.1 orange carotenoid protein N-terminal domain-containing protein [Oscillatoria sp. CS-180]